ncbi:hypothetical protein, partial [Enterococcus faecalis]|uniref:hypothetical protein n=1 Tax=Enterococcus faecalis TaxID=1351 RepID=UPI003D6BC408
QRDLLSQFYDYQIQCLLQENQVIVANYYWLQPLALLHRRLISLCFDPLTQGLGHGKVLSCPSLV